MPRFGTKSKMQLHTCDERLVDLFREVVKHFDCTVIEGHRGKDKQNEAYNKGNSKIKFSNDKYCESPNTIMVVTPYTIEINNNA